MLAASFEIFSTPPAQRAADADGPIRGAGDNGDRDFALPFVCKSGSVSVVARERAVPLWELDGWMKFGLFIYEMLAGGWMAPYRFVMSRHVRVGWCGKSRSSALVPTLELVEGKGSVLGIQISCIIHVCMVHICSPTETKWKLVGWGDYACGSTRL